MASSSKTTPCKIKRQDPVFKTPMTYSPRVLSNGKPMPSPSRSELWKKQLGFDDADMDKESTSESDSDEENKNPAAPSSSNISLIEYKALQRELEERSHQRDELLFKVKTLSDKNKQYKNRLEKEEANKRQQMKILVKTQETQLQEKDNLISHLQALLEELEGSPRGNSENGAVQHPAELTNSRGKQQNVSNNTSSLSQLVEEIKRLQVEKAELCQQLEELKASKDHVAAESRNGDSNVQLQQLVSHLQSENKELRQYVDRLNKQTQPSDMGLCHTDTEKQVDKLQEENQKLKAELQDMQASHARSAEMVRQGTEQFQAIEKELKKSQEMITLLESRHKDQMSALQTEQLRHRQEQQAWQSQNQTGARKIRELQAELTALQAKEPEIVTKIKRVEVQIESEELKAGYRKCMAEKEAFYKEVKRLEHDILQVKDQLLTATNQCEEHVQQKSKMEKEMEIVMNQLTGEIEDQKRLREETVEQVKQDAEKSVHGLKVKYQIMCSKIKQLREVFAGLFQSYCALRKETLQLPQFISSTVKQVQKETFEAINSISTYNQELIRRYHKEMHLRKKYHNELVELKGNIRVFCRVRPQIKEDGRSAVNVITYDHDDDGIIYVNNKGRPQTFDVDKVFTEESTQTQVFSEVQALVTSCIDGYNVCIFAYGQTGSGKTYTMEGSSLDPGINQRALQLLFKETADRGVDWSYTITVSVLEIYNEMIRDLLSDDVLSKLEVKMNTDGSLYVQGLCNVHVQSVEDVNRVFAVGQKNRATATTNMNEHSSRSHALLCINVTGLNKTTNVRTTGKLNLVDLAGSERVSKSGADGARLKEAQSINKSLSCLGDVIHALRSKQSHVPYRNSRLTYLLQDSLGGDSKTLMIVQASPVEKNLAESVCTLNFAQRVRSVELGQATRKVENGDPESACSPRVATPSRVPRTNSSQTPSTPTRQSGMPGTPSHLAGLTPLGRTNSSGRLMRTTSKMNL